MTSQSNSQVSVTIDGAPFGIWDSLSGGATTASLTKRRPGGTRREKASRGRATTDDLTVGKEYELDSDVDRLRGLRPRVGRAAVVVTDQPLDDDDVPFGQPTTYTGILSSLSTGDVDSDSDDFRMCEIGVTVEAVS